MTISKRSPGLQHSTIVVIITRSLFFHLFPSLPVLVFFSLPLSFMTVWLIAVNLFLKRSLHGQCVSLTQGYCRRQGLHGDFICMHIVVAVSVIKTVWDGLKGRAWRDSHAPCQQIPNEIMSVIPVWWPSLFNSSPLLEEILSHFNTKAPGHVPWHDVQVYDSKVLTCCIIWSAWCWFVQFKSHIWSIEMNRWCQGSPCLNTCQQTVPLSTGFYFACKEVRHHLRHHINEAGKWQKPFCIRGQK